jgi:hypothetical protein
MNHASVEKHKHFTHIEPKFGKLIAVQLSKFFKLSNVTFKIDWNDYGKQNVGLDDHENVQFNTFYFNCGSYLLPISEKY